MPIDIQRIRSKFPSLAVTDEGQKRIYFDNPGGTQVAEPVIDRTIQYLSTSNSNCGGAFRTSIETDELMESAHDAMGSFLNAASGREIIFGQNMTSLTFSISRSLGSNLNAGDEIVVSRMDHDANVSPWLMLAEDRNLVVKWLDFDPSSFRYDYDMLDGILGDRTRIVAVNHASNAIGTINDVRHIADRAHDVGALIYVDSVQFAPHAPIDVQALDCDFLVCSAYKFFGPHQGILWGRANLLEELRPYKVRPADDTIPHRFETGTLSHEGLAGTLGAIEYLEWLGKEMGISAEPESITTDVAGQTTPDPGGMQMQNDRSAGGRSSAAAATSSRTTVLHNGMKAIQEYEKELSQALIQGLQEIDGVTIYGLTAESDLQDRVPTVSFTFEGRTPREVTEALASHNIFAWDGHYYAVEVVQRLGLYSSGGMVRVGMAHYNTVEEVEYLLKVLRSLIVH